MIAEYHPHTVRDSGVPLYMQGFPLLGQDPSSPDFVPIDTSSYDPGNVLTEVPPDFGSPITLLPSGSDLNLNPTMFDPTGPLVNTVPTVDSNTQDIANLYAGAVASGAMTPADAAAKTAAAIASISKGITPFIFPKQPALGPGASPRVATRPPGTAPAGASILSSQTMIKGVPDIALIGGGALLLIAMMGKR
jgi:hypothetical protein